jgi:uncharacterized protein (TIGR03067 family)
MTKALLSLTLVFVVAGTLPADDAEKDLKKLVGTWQEVSNIDNGKERPAADVKSATVVIDASGKWEALKDGTVYLKGAVKLDPSKKPRAADWSVEGLDKPVLGIYEVDGDTWKHCFAPDKRPTEFGSKEGSGVTYIVLKRVKK